MRVRMRECERLTQDMRAFKVMERPVQVIARVVLGYGMHLLLVGLSSFCVHSPTPGNQPDFDAEKTSGSFTS
jgi:hypothetical protein